jgi:MarR family transcriptional regulator, multiple gene regulator MgrA
MIDKIAQVIHQTQFESPHHKILLGLMLINSRLQERQNDILKQYDLSLQQYNVLRILRGQYPNKCKLHIIKERMIDRMSDSSRIVERLRKSGYLTRVTKDGDRRAVDIEITDTGLVLLKEIDKQKAYFHEPIERLESDDVDHLAILLDKLLKQLMTTESEKITE